MCDACASSAFTAAITSATIWAMVTSNHEMTIEPSTAVPRLMASQGTRPREATAEVLRDGWLHTGDIGEIDERGFLRVTDREKELIVTAGGKNVAAQELENLLKGRRFVSNGLVFGDKMKYLVALVTLNEPEIAKWARDEGMAFGDYSELILSDKVHQIVQGDIAAMNKNLASYESINMFKILPRDFTIESGELTPSLKPKRKVCVARYKGEIEATS